MNKFSGQCQNLNQSPEVPRSSDTRLSGGCPPRSQETIPIPFLEGKTDEAIAHPETVNLTQSIPAMRHWCFHQSNCPSSIFRERGQEPSFFFSALSDFQHREFHNRIQKIFKFPHQLIPHLPISNNSGPPLQHRRRPRCFCSTMTPHIAPYVSDVSFCKSAARTSSTINTASISSQRTPRQIPQHSPPPHT